MKEQDFLNIIQDKVDNDYIGDDCAYLKELGIVVTQDSLVENIHFKRAWYTPEQLGYKSIAVNISDVLASGAIPSYLTVALSLPNDVNTEFVERFYTGANKALYGAKIVGGDITGSQSDIVISVCAIGKDQGRKISSRKNAKPGYKIIVTGREFGLSAYGLDCLINNNKNSLQAINTHLLPELDFNFSKIIASNIKEDYAMMDTSDGLADALFKIAEMSNVTIEINQDSIPHYNFVSYDKILFGGEDYKLVAAVPENFVNKINDAVIIGHVENYNGTRLNISGKCYNKYEELNVYNHFGEHNG